MIDRRAFLKRTFAASSLAMSAATRPLRAQSSPDSITVAAVGDCILTRRVSELKDARFLKLVDLLRAADCLYGNCEMVIADRESGGYPMFEGSALSVVSHSEIARELAWLGFDIMGTANNHSWDFGQPGIVASRANLKRAGIASAGTGLDLEQAAAPAYTESAAGRVALINCASTFRDYAVAYPSRADMPGIPGLNPVRVDVRFELERSAFDSLRKTAEALKPLGGAGNVLGNSNPAPSIAPDKISMFGNTFVPGAKNAVIAEAAPRDVARITDAIRQARRNARIVLVSIHAHEPGAGPDTPSPFLQPFARACIDAGADAFFGAGSHVTWPIEIYKNRPICYGLGDFFFQYETVPAFAADVYESFGLAAQTADPSEATDRLKLAGGANLWQTVVPVITFDKAGASRIALHPVTLSMDEPRFARGTPRLAEGAEAGQILDRVARLSVSYGTSIEIRDGVGNVNWRRG